MENSLLWMPVTLFVKEILELKPSEIGYIMHGYNIKCVQVTGIVTAKDATSKFIEYALDDGTGVLSVIYWHDEADINLGDLVTVKGKIQDYRGKRQINISQLLVEKDANMELLRILISISNHDIYDRPISQLQHEHINTPKFQRVPMTKVCTDSIYVTETDLSLFILDWIKEHHSTVGNFCYDQILQESKVMNYAQNVLKYQYNDDNPNQSRLSILVKNSINDLTKQGIIYLTDEDNDMYSFLCVSDLDQIVNDWFRHNSCPELLICRLKEEAKYQHSTRARVKESIGRLIQNGSIYEKEPGAYGCV